MNEPKLRFPEFTEEWVPYKLNNICEKITDGSHHSPSEVENGYPMPSVKNMLPNGFDIENSKKISKHDYELLCSQGCKPEIGDVVVAKDGSVLKYAFEIKKSEPIVILSSIAIMKPNHSILDGGFLAQSITVPHFKERIIAENTTGTGVPRIVLANFKNIFISLPKIEEQQKIASLFTELDTLIQSAEKELEGYRELKQGMLQKMFPKKGEKVPEVRFPEFTDDWELCKLGDTIPVVTDYVAAGSFADIAANVDYKSKPDYAQLVRTVDLKHNFKNNDSIYVDKKAFDYLYRVNLDEESIVLPNIGANIGEVYYIEPSELPYKRNVLGPNAIYLKPCKNTKFIYSLFQTVDFQKKLMISVASSGQPKFNKTELKEIMITLPNNDEQKKIGEYFSNLDNLITHQQQELDGYKELKKGLLQQMFC